MGHVQNARVRRTETGSERGAVTSGLSLGLKSSTTALRSSRWGRWGLLTLGGLAFYLALGAVFTNKPGILVQGIVVGGLTALIAFGISLIYRANRIVNFAQGDLGGFPAAFAVLLIVGPGWPFFAAFGAGLLLALVVGVLVEILVIRRFANAPRLILTVATIGLAQLFAGISVVLPRAFDLTIPPQRYPSPFDFKFFISPITFSGADVVAMLAVPIAILALTWLLQRTDIGIAIRASAESADRASLLGVPVGQVRIVVWVLASVLAFVAMFLRAGIFGLPIGSVLGPTVLLRALAACVIGRMENLTVIFIACAGIGILESAVVFTEQNTLLVDPIVFVALLVALLFQNRDKLSRFTEASSWQSASAVRPIPRELARLPEVLWGRRAFLLLGLGLAAALPVFLDDGDVNRAAGVVIFGIVAISLVVLTGWTGQVSLGPVAFMGIGAAVGGVVTSTWHWDLSLSLVIAGLVGTALALVVGLPALRVRGLLLAVVTLSLALAVSSYALNRSYVGWLPEGRVPRTPLFGRIIVESETRYYYLCLAVLVLVLAMVSALRSARTGRVLIATRDNERATQAYGVNTTGVKLTGFAVSGFLAAMAGALYIHHQQALGVSAYEAEDSIRVFTMTVIGGLGSVPGALLGAVYVQATSWVQGVVPDGYEALVGFLGTGIGLLFVLMLLPGGLGSLIYFVRDRLLRFVARRRGIIVPSLVADVRQDDTFRIPDSSEVA